MDVARVDRAAVKQVQEAVAQAARAADLAEEVVVAATIPTSSDLVVRTSISPT